MRTAVNVDDFRRRARKRLPRAVFDYLDGGADDERCLRRNRAAFDDVEFLPKRLRDVATRDITTELFGVQLNAPLVVGPTAFNGLFWRDGDLALARAASHHGLPFVLSTCAQATLEEVAEAAPGNLWFQLYVVDRRSADSLVRRASDAGYRTLVLTVDMPVGGKRERDIRNAFRLPLPTSPRTIALGVRHPRWLYHFLTHGRRAAANLAGSGALALMRREMDAGLTWDYLRQLRQMWPHRLVVKGILDQSDVVRCAECGVDAIGVSNHGGRQIDSVPAPVAVLSHMVSSTTLPLLVDSGFRRGSDVIKALTLGARAVVLGRAVLYGLAAGGEAGVCDVLAILKSEIDGTLAQIGCASVRALTPDYIAHNERRRAWGGQKDVSSAAT